MTERFTYRTYIEDADPYERALADRLFDIMGRHVHDPAGIVAELNAHGPALPTGDAWTVDTFKAEIERLGAYTNAIGCTVGGHDANPVSERIRD